MNQSILSIMLGIVVSQFAVAGTGVSEGPGPVGSYVQCEGELDQYGKVSFEVRATAVVSMVDAILLDSHSNRLIAQMYCKKGKPIAKRAPSAGRIDWSCGASDAGIFVVQVMTGGPTGITTAQVYRKQMYPLQPELMGTMFCKVPTQQSGLR